MVPKLLAEGTDEGASGAVWRVWECGMERWAGNGYKLDPQYQKSWVLTSAYDPDQTTIAELARVKDFHNTSETVPVLLVKEVRIMRATAMKALLTAAGLAAP